MEYISTHSLSLILWVLTIGAIAISFLPLCEQKARMTALLSSLAALAISLYQYLHLFDPSKQGAQLVETYNWIGNIKFALGVDGLGYSMILLMGILLPCAIIASKPIAEQQKPRLYYSLILFLALAVNAVFMAKDLFLFFLAWELELVPIP